MTPTPQEHVDTQQDVVYPVEDKDRIVISGISGLYPRSHHIKDLSDILYNKENPISSETVRWRYNHPEVAQHTGNVPDLERFDAQFFKVHFRLGNCMDPMARKILEQAYNAIYDAGINPDQLSGKKIGVFVGSCFSEAEKACFYDATSRSGFGITGCCKAMFANRISYWLNAKGPSMAIDEACCSSAAALEQAYLAMSRGDCEGAIVGGTYLCLHPQSSVHYGRIMKQAMDGKTKSFDENADGTVKSEAINVLFLQKAKDAFRVYADVIHAKTEFIGVLQGETGPKYGFLRNMDSTVNFLKKFYEEAKVQPQAIEYVEAFGSAVPEADKAELETIDSVFCKEKDDPLLVGSITSNIGYVEAASAISGVTKVLLGYHTGNLAANLHCEKPRQDVEAVREGRIKILTDHQSFGRTYAAVNGMSVTGMNSHILLHGHYKPKDLSRYKSNIPHLVTLSARQDNVVEKMIDNLKSRPIDPEELALLHSIHQSNITGHLGRGFVILGTNEEQETISLAEKAEYFDDARRPLWFVYSGMGSQWAGMGTQLMRIPIFAAAIENCRRALEPKGIDIVHIITSDDAKIFDNILHSFVGIAAVQMGLTDVLRNLGLVPDGIIGHSVGELGCAYADGCLTAEEMILSAYSRGLVSLQTPFIRGSMAAVGLGFEKVSKLIPSEIEVACHNGPESSTISGPSDIMREFVAELTARGIFAKEVPCSNIAYHSRYIADAGPALLKYLKEVIKSPKQRSERWVSTSVPKDRWNEQLAKYSSAEYHTNNLLCPVLFEETLPEIPNNAVLVEVAPHGLLQAILKRSLPSDCRNIALTRRNHPDNTFLLLEAVGKLYMEGYNTKIQNLYPKVEMPVSTGTPFLSHYIEWAHGEKWAMPLYRSAYRVKAAAYNCTVSLHDTEFKYLEGHVIREKILFPSAAILVTVWDTLAMSMNVPKKELSVEFRDVYLHVQPVLYDQTQLKLRVQMQRGTGNFEVLDENITLASGCIVAVKSKDAVKTAHQQNNKIVQDLTLTAEDIYALFRERDYLYSGDFCTIERANESLNEAELIWRNNWVTFIDGMLQLNTLKQSQHTISNLTQIRRICISVDEHAECIKVVTGNKVVLKAEVSEKYNFTRCGGILIEDVEYNHLPATTNNKIELDTLQFIQNEQDNIDIVSSILIFLQIVAENVNKDIINIIGITDSHGEGAVFEKMKNIGTNVFDIKFRYKQMNIQSSMKNRALFDKADVVIVNNLSTNEEVSQQLHQLLRLNTFIIIEEDKVLGRVRPSALYCVLSTLSGEPNSRSQLQLVRWRPTPSAPVATAVTIRSPNDFPLLSSARFNLPQNYRLLVFSPYPAPASLKNLIQSWRKEADRNLIQLIMINNKGGELFVDELPDVNLAFSVVNECKWGGVYYLPVKNKVTEVKNLILRTSQIGDYKSLNWTEGPQVTRNELTINVHYAGISNIDIKKANGLIPFEKESDNCFGMDFSGTTASGERVMGIVKGGAASTQVLAQPELLWPVPAYWTLKEAATVPLAYIYALYCLALKSELLPGQSILIHGGCGAIGQAAIAIALSLGCQVFTTVSDIRKKKLLLQMFPELKERHIGNSRDESFADMVLWETNGKGCSCVLNNVKQELKNVSYKCCEFLGIVIDLIRYSNQKVILYGMSHLSEARNYASVDLSSIFKTENIEELRRLQVMLSEGIVRGYVRPLSRVTYEPQEVTTAFRLLAESRNRGRVLLHMHGNKASIQNSTTYRISCNPDHCQLILFDEESFGLQLVERFINRGVKNLHIHSSAYSTAKFQLKLRSWQKSGVRVQVSSEKLYTEKDVIDLLNKALQLGSLQGIYTIVGAGQNIHESLFAALDSASRKLCPTLRYFSVINTGNNMSGHSTCTSRVRSKLPTTLLSLTEFNNANSGNWRDALDAVEGALHVPEAILRARIVPASKPTLLEQIASLAEIKISKDTSKTTTLIELGVKDDKLQSVATFLRVHYNVSFTDEQLQLLTLETILHLEKTDSSFEDVKGLGVFLSYVDSDELAASTKMVIMPTVTSDVLRDDEFDTTQSYVYIIPGIEGHHKRFSELCERLKLPALVLQSSLDHPHETVHDIAKGFVEFLMTKTTMKDNFYLLGYEFGILVALEMASILEEHGLTGTIYCIGYAPDELLAVMKENLSEYKTEEQLQDAVVHHMFKLMAGEDIAELALDKALENATTWTQKLNVCVQFIRGRVSHSVQYAIALIEAAFMRLKQVRCYSATAHPLRSRLILLRAAPVPTSPVTTSMQQHSQQPVVVHQLRAPLAHAANDTRCAAIVNSYLDSETLSAFEKKNICDTYLLNPNSFMSITND